MNYPKTPEYRFDLSGVHPDNLIKQEKIMIDFAKAPIIVPRHAPFYLESVNVFLPTGELLVENTDYEFFHIDGELTRYTGKETGIFIKILNKNITELYIDYQTPGSLSLAGASLYDLYELISTTDKPVNWDDITNKPTLFDPENHTHNVMYDIYGFKDFANIIGTLIDWFVPELTYNRDGIGTFSRYDLATNNQEFIKVKTDSGAIMRMFVTVNSKFNGLTSPAPHLDYFIQKVKNGLRFINNYVASYSKELASHIANQNNAHGVTLAQLNLGNRDNFLTRTLAKDADNKNYSEKKLVTPAWFANIASGFKGRSDNYVERETLPISYFGDSTYIAPVIDSKVYGLGTNSGFGVMCLERGGWLSAIINAVDPDNDVLMYLKVTGFNKRQFNLDDYGGIAAQTKKIYRPSYLVTNNISPNVVLKGGDYRWMVIGDTKVNKWFLVKTNGTLNGDSHVFYPITFPVTITKGLSLSTQMTISDSAKKIIFINNNLAVSSQLDLTLWSLDISNLSATSNIVKPLLVSTVNENGVATASNNGAWKPFPVVKDSNGKYTRWFSTFKTPLSNIFNNRGVLCFVKQDSNGKDLYFRLYAEPTLSTDTASITPTISVVFKFTLQNDGSYLPSIVKGDPTKVFDSSAWDFSKEETYANHLTDSTNLPFINEFFDVWTRSGLNTGDSISTSLLADGSYISLGSVHWTFYPLSLEFFDKSNIDLVSDSGFKTGNALALSNVGNEVIGKINNIGSSGISSYLACYSNLKTQSDSNNDYELVRAELGNAEFITIGRKRSGDRTGYYTSSTGAQWGRSSASADIRKTNIPSDCFRISLIDDRNTTDNGETIFGVVGYNAKSLSGDGTYSATYEYKTDLKGDPDLISLKETKRLIFSQSVIKSLIGQVSQNALYDGEQSNWNIYWPSNNGGKMIPLIVVSWLETANGITSQKLGIGTISTKVDAASNNNYKLSSNGILEFTPTKDQLVVDKIIVKDVGAVNSFVNKDFWLTRGIAHIQAGHASIYINSSGEITFSANTSMYLASSKALSPGNSRIIFFSMKFSSFNQPTGDVWTTISNWDATSMNPTPVKKLGFLLNRNIDSVDYIGGSVFPGIQVGSNYADLITAYSADNSSKPKYHVFDLRISASFIIYLSSAWNVILNGASRTLKAQKIDLSSVKANPANTTFYIYLEERNGGGIISVRLNPVPETSRMVYIGTAITNSTGISSISVNPVFTMNGYRISDTPIGSAIPSSSGSVTTTGTFAWGTK